MMGRVVERRGKLERREKVVGQKNRWMGRSATVLVLLLK